LASLAQRTGLLSAASKPSRKGWPVIQTELEPLIKPVVGLIEASRDVVRSSQGNCFDLRTADINADPHAALPRTRPSSSAEQ
jgi:hypothetical protein